MKRSVENRSFKHAIIRSTYNYLIHKVLILTVNIMFNVHSKRLIQGPAPPNKLGTNALFTFWAQFMDHDLTITGDQRGSNAEKIDILIPKGDPFMDPTGKGDVKINQARSDFIKDSKPRIFPNGLPSLIDANTVYGFN